VREAKLATMREFISLMEGRNTQEINEAVQNLQVTKAHFDEAFTRVRASVNREAREMYEHMRCTKVDITSTFVTQKHLTYAHYLNIYINKNIVLRNS
jgi:hypothetical protein